MDKNGSGPNLEGMTRDEIEEMDFDSRDIEAQITCKVCGNAFEVSTQDSGQWLGGIVGQLLQVFLVNHGDHGHVVERVVAEEGNAT
jgi:hypothetical protein